MKGFSRSSACFLYSKIAHEHSQRLKTLEMEIQKHNKSLYNSEEDSLNDLYERSKYFSKAQECALITIVFSAMALEAYIYDYGARNTSGNFINRYIDKLDILSKWVIIPQLVTSKKFPTDSKGFQLLKELISNRNHFIHYKSFDINEETMKELEHADEELFKSSYDSITAIRELAKEIEELIQMNPHISFLCLIIWMMIVKLINNTIMAMLTIIIIYTNYYCVGIVI